MNQIYGRGCLHIYQKENLVYKFTVIVVCEFCVCIEHWNF